MWHNGKQQDAKYFGVMILAFMFSGLVALAVADQIGPTTDPGWLPDIKGAGFIPAFAASFLVILVSEIGDKTFFIAAILSMKNNFLVVFAGAIGALSVMTVLSAGLGVLLPNLLSREITHYSCIVLFAFFGVRLLHDALTSEGTGPNEELKEVEMELAGPDSVEDPETPFHYSPPTPSRSTLLDRIRALHTAGLGWWNLDPLRRVFFQSFLMTFLAEWGDRSQIATIALASVKDPIGVTLGGVAGHSICTGVAVIGGKLLATKISEKTVNISGGILFLVFAMSSLIMGVDK